MNGISKPITAADALDALKRSVGLSALEKLKMDTEKWGQSHTPELAVLNYAFTFKPSPILQRLDAMYRRRLHHQLLRR